MENSDRRHQPAEIKSPSKAELIAEREMTITKLEAATTPAEIRRALTEIYTPAGQDPIGYAPTNPDDELLAIKERVLASSKNILGKLKK